MLIKDEKGRFVKGMTKLVECNVSFKIKDTRYTISNPEGEEAEPTRDTSTYLAVGGNPTADTPLMIYKRSGDTFTKLDGPAIMPTNLSRDIDFSHNGTYLAVAHANSPYITIYKRSGDTFTKLNNPASLPSADVEAVAFSHI